MSWGPTIALTAITKSCPNVVFTFLNYKLYDNDNHLCFALMLK